MERTINFYDLLKSDNSINVKSDNSINANFGAIEQLLVRECPLNFISQGQDPLLDFPIRVMPYQPQSTDYTYEEEAKVSAIFREQLKLIIGDYASLRCFASKPYHPNLIPLSNAMTDYNRRNLRENGMYVRQIQLTVDPFGVFFQYGIMQPFHGVPLMDTRYKLANIGYIIRV
jgi:hypothetical protein